MGLEGKQDEVAMWHIRRIPQRSQHLHQEYLPMPAQFLILAKSSNRRVVHHPASQEVDAKRLEIVSSNVHRRKYLGHTWHNNVLVMSHKVFQNSERGSFNIHISPVYPAVVWSQGRTQKPIPRLCHQLSPACLRSESVTRFDILVYLLSEILLNDRNFAIWHLRICVGLQRLQELRKQRQSSILGVRD